MDYGFWLLAVLLAALILLVPAAATGARAGAVRQVPWFTIALAALLALSPPGVALIGAIVRWSPTDWLKEAWLATVIGAAVVLLVLGLVEWLVRRSRA
jgi:hypothetical protein